jgi:hypothetical protein
VILVVQRLRYGLWAKALMPGHKRLAKMRLLYWLLIRRYETELCQRCGGPVRLVFHVPDAIWEAVTGFARSPGGECGAGVLCPACVDELYDGLTFLRWTCALDDTVMTG